MPGRVHSDAESKRKPDVAADSMFRAVLEQPTAAEAQKLEQVAHALVWALLKRLRCPQEQLVSMLRRAALVLRARLCARPKEQSLWRLLLQIACRKWHGWPKAL